MHESHELASINQDNRDSCLPEERTEEAVSSSPSSSSVKISSLVQPHLADQVLMSREVVDGTEASQLLSTASAIGPLHDEADAILKDQLGDDDDW